MDYERINQGLSITGKFDSVLLDVVVHRHPIRDIIVRHNLTHETDQRFEKYVNTTQMR